MKSAHFNLKIPTGWEDSVREEMVWEKVQSVLVTV